jgi:hypothetical protein
MLDGIHANRDSLLQPPLLTFALSTLTFDCTRTLLLLLAFTAPLIRLPALNCCSDSQLPR